MTKKSHILLAWVPHLFLFYKEKVFKKLMPIMLVLTVYAIVIGIWFRNTSGYDLGQFHLIFSFILTIIISFRVNSSYGRWWEGRTLWGSIVNNSRNLGLKFDTFFGLNQHPDFYLLLKKLPVIIKANLRNNTKLLKDELGELGITEFKSQQPVLLVVQPMYRIINSLRNGTRDRAEQCTQLENHLAALIDMSGGCERIANTRVPPAYAFFVKQALLFYSLMFPFGWVQTFGVLIIPMMVMIVYVLLGLEILSEELEDPFKVCDNGLNLDVISRKIELNIVQIAGNEHD
ncbi:bestrophin family ion channel [Legionella quateirensis]|uniref:Bestrophin, RFP-TM, chloride channel n=1 Tax=Legionella quateirensis TaxID=45072 RepID=A0A378KU69_9GAMM|nr:bestrophin family ion channel [Legionella quateirensis]KTD54748.1 Bestrophin, RFP-TM, chloride channel [Legionella quateirensis]STY16928.1 Predicted membrane protein [Legionella quateirensis]